MGYPVYKNRGCYAWNTSKFCSFQCVCLHQVKGCRTIGCCHYSYECRTWTKSSSHCTSSNAATTDLPCSIPCASTMDVCASTNAWQIPIPCCDELPCLPIWPTTCATWCFTVIITWYCSTALHSFGRLLHLLWHLVFTGPVCWTGKKTEIRLNPTAKDQTTGCGCTNSEFFWLPVATFVEKLKTEKNRARPVATGLSSRYVLDLTHAHFSLIVGLWIIKNG